MVALVYAMSGWDVAPPVGAEPAEGGLSFSFAPYAAGFRHFALGVSGAAVLIMVLALWLPSARPFRALVLHSAAGGTSNETPVMRDAARAKAGDSGTARSALRPYGTVEIAGRLVEAAVEGDYIQSGTAVRVREVRGEKIIVEAV
jgi:membrane-bound serine protease (ClpP class)